MAGEGVQVGRPVRPRHRFSPRRRRQLRRWTIYALTLVFFVWVLFNADWATLQRAFFDPEIFSDLFPEIVTVAARNTVTLTALAFTGGLGLGLMLALMRLSSIGPYRWFALAYIELFRGIPAILTLILVGFVLPIALGVRIPDIFPFLGPYATPAVGLSIVAGAYLAETIRGGIEAVPKGQREAARSLGMTEGRAMSSIVIPQAFRVMIPPLTNEFVLLLKDTSLVFVLGVAAADRELTFFSRAAVQRTFNGTPLIAAALMYLAITLPLTALSRYLERRGPSSPRRRLTRPATSPPAAATSGPAVANDRVSDG